MDPKLDEQLASAFPAATDAEVERAITEGVLLADDDGRPVRPDGRRRAEAGPAEEV